MEKWIEQLVKQWNRHIDADWRVSAGEDGNLRLVPGGDQAVWQPEQLQTMEALLHAMQEMLEKANAAPDDVGSWLRKALQSGLTEWRMSQTWVRRFGMEVPLTVYRLYSKEMPAAPVVRPLLRTYFGESGHLHIVELDRSEWLIFLGFGRNGKVADQLDDTLAHAQGLHELLLVELAADVQVLAERARRWFRGSPEETEWDGSPLLQTVQQMRQIGRLAREWLPGQSVHGLWMFRMEQMMMTLPAATRSQWQQMLGGTARWQAVFSADPEMERTLLAWIQSDANVTAAARELYIHRNTLMYRLDKLQVELGLDPRKLNDLILIRIGYSLNKMHKK